MGKAREKCWEKLTVQYKLVYTSFMTTYQQNWTVANAKAQLSEVLRRARTEGPQRIGVQNPCIVVSEEEFLRFKAAKQNLGVWLLENMAGVGDIEWPDRADPPRPIPFEGDV